MDNHIEFSMDKYIGKMLDDRYELLEVIGIGGMAIVYKALCHRLNRYVAIKILRDDSPADSDVRRRFRSESQAVAMLSHPNIVAVYDVNHSDDMEYIVMELIDGITLKDYMKQRGALTSKEVLHFTSQILKALSHAHSKGIVHRDIKPHNIMLLEDGTVKVADFGIACPLSDTQETGGEAFGSVHYASPEQARGTAVDGRSDLYSLGIVMYEMLTARLPYEGEDATQVALQHLSSVPLAPSKIKEDIPAELEAITLKAMDSNIAMRYQSADEMLADLEQYRLNQLSAVPAEQDAAEEEEKTELPIPEEDYYIIKRNVTPIGTSGEMPAEAYKRRRSRSRKVSTLSGILGVLVFIIVIFVALWQYWLRGLFEDAERIEMPNFVGENVNEIKADPNYEDFVFTVTEQIEPNIDAGTVMTQKPEAGQSVMKVPDGISVALTVSSGQIMVPMPDVVNTDYRQATTELQKLGLTVEKEVVSDPSITKDYVISSIPAEGEELPAGSKVFLRVSGGPEVVTVPMPNLIGYFESTAISKIESLNLVLGEVNYIPSDQYEKGVVIWQNINPNEEVEQYSKVYISVSTGAKETEEEEDTMFG